jgi:hypothetical protein
VFFPRVERRPQFESPSQFGIGIWGPQTVNHNKTNNKKLVLALFLLPLIAACLVWRTYATANGGVAVQGAGTSILTGGGPGTTPIITKLGINFEDGSGRFDCLALTPTPAAGSQGSGIFDNNIMYVTGPITGASIQGNTATLTGTATVTGVGAGTNVPFIVTAEPGGPGARVVLVVSGVTFVETLLEGSITFPGED